MGGSTPMRSRGGSEYGEDWHQGGMTLKNRMCFDDFIAAREWLIEQIYLDAELAIAVAAMVVC